MVNFRKVFL
jgi:hypothetical protein